MPCLTEAFGVLQIKYQVFGPGVVDGMVRRTAVLAAEAWRVMHKHLYQLAVSKATIQDDVATSELASFGGRWWCWLVSQSGWGCATAMYDTRIVVWLLLSIGSCFRQMLPRWRI